MTAKQLALINEIQQYLPFDNKLSQTEKMRLLALDCNFDTDWAQIVYDYFYSHIDDNGNSVSLNEFLQQHGCYDTHYKNTEKVFICKL